nr:hypothetical protein [Tanacetum cinerariifolium]
HAIAHDEGWVPSAKRVKISPTNARLETSVKQKEETFQIVINLIKHSTCFKAFTISADVPEIFMQQKILDICLRKEGEDFTKVQNDEDTLTFLVDLGYTGSLYKYTNMFVDHMHLPWRTLAACINKCLCGKTASNDKLRKSRIDILWGMFYRENVDYPALIWEDIAYQINHKKEKKSRRKIMPYPRLTKVIINYFLSKHKSLKKLKFQHYHTIKDDDTVSRLKYVRIREDYQEYGLSILETMMNVDIIESESYQRFFLYSTGSIPSKKSKGKEPLFRKKTSKRKVVKKKATISAADNIVPDPDLALKLSKSISLNEAEEEAAARQENKQETAGTGGSDEGTGMGKVILEWGSDKDSKRSDKDADAEKEDEETESDSEDIYKYKIKVRKDADEEIKDADNVECENKEKEVIYNETK